MITFLFVLGFIDKSLEVWLFHDVFWNLGMRYSNTDLFFPAVFLVLLLLGFNWLSFGKLTMWIKK